MTTLLLSALLCFAAVAVFAPVALGRLSSTRRLRAPHPGLVAMFRLWFGGLALATAWLLLQHGRPQG